MFQGLIKDAQTAASAVIARYAVRASVAVPFIVALGFATLAITFMLVEHFGPIIAFWLVAAGFTIIGTIAALAVVTTEQVQEEADVAAVKADTGKVASEAVDQAVVQAPLALLSGLLTSVGGPTTALGIGRLVGRNLPLLLLAGIVGVLLIPGREPSEGTGAEGAAEPPDLARLNGAGGPERSTPRENGRISH